MLLLFIYYAFASSRTHGASRKDSRDAQPCTSLLLRFSLGSARRT